MVDVMFEEKDMAKAVWQDLPPDVRAKFMNVAEDRLEFGKQHSYVKKPTKHQMLRLAFLAGLPMIGFGFMDNAIMIIAGDYLDTQLCVHLGLTTLFAAAIGNVFSDVAGVATAGPIESIIRNMGIRGPGMTPGQMRLPIVMVMKYVGTALGVTVGCILGMFPLLWPKEYRLWPSRDEVCGCLHTRSLVSPLRPLLTTHRLKKPLHKTKGHSRSANNIIPRSAQYIEGPMSATSKDLWQEAILESRVPCCDGDKKAILLSAPGCAVLNGPGGKPQRCERRLRATEEARQGGRCSFPSGQRVLSRRCILFALLFRSVA